MKLLVGLGNPGVEYENTRHNIGFVAIDQFLKDYESLKQTVWREDKKFKADIVEIEWQRSHPLRDGIVNQPLLEKVYLVKPKTFMNNSGQAVAAIANFYKISTEDIWILHDDVDFPEGSLRIRQGGASGGHRGVMSVIDDLGSDQFWRFRLGIGRPNEVGHDAVSHHVLDELTAQDHAKVREMLKHASQAIQLGLEKDLTAAMNKYNTK